MRAAVKGAPAPVEAWLGPLPADVALPADADADWLILFVPDRASLAARWADARATVKPGGLLWVACPKESGPLKNDLKHDVGWEPVAADDWHPVMQIAINVFWSALRFRPRGEISRMTPKF